jgi:hypothetical protein
MIEAQIEHLLNVMRYMEQHGVAVLEPRQEAQAAYALEIQRRMKGTVWTAGGCASWYLDRKGRNSTLWPDFTWRFRRRVTRLDPGDYVLSGPHRAQAPTESG